MQPVLALVHPAFCKARWTRSVHRSHSYPFHWARLRGNSCALRLRVLCFSVSSPKNFGNNREVFLCPSRNADPRLGSSPHSLFSAPITRAENGETKSCTKTKSSLSGILARTRSTRPQRRRAARLRSCHSQHKARGRMPTKNGNEELSGIAQSLYGIRREVHLRALPV